MHIDSSSLPPGNPGSGGIDPRPWYKQLNRYHWFVLTVAALGWLFDCLDQQLFILARPAAMKELIPEEAYANPVDLDMARRQGGDIATTLFMLGWATGGLVFGILGDRIGRARTMVITILMYSLFTGLSSFSTGVVDFSIYRFLTGLGVGGEFAVGVALVAEVMPTGARSYTLALLQGLSGIGNISAALINLGLGVAAEQGMEYSPWRIMFLIGAIPALLALYVRRHLKEPEGWQKAARSEESGAKDKKLGSYRDLFRDPVLRKHALLGLVLGCSGIIGLWSVGFFTTDLIRLVQQKPLTTQLLAEQRTLAEADGNQSRVQLLDRLSEAVLGTTEMSDLSEGDKTELKTLSKTVDARLTKWQSYTSIAQNIGAALGMFGFGYLAQKFGRRPAFAVAFIAAFISTVTVFGYLEHFWQIWVLVPIMGFCQLSLFAGYAIYFPELFPTRLRSTGTSFCYNVGRFVAALGPMVKGQLEVFFKDTSEPLRYAGVTMSCIFLVGLFVLPFLPETRNKPLPE